MTAFPPETPHTQPPVQSAPTYSAQAGHSAAAYPPPYVASPSGAKFWALLFLFYIPYVGLLVGIIVALVQRAKAKASPYPIVRENARWAANWALSYAVYFIVLLALFIALGVVTSQPPADGVGPAEPSLIIALPGTVFFAVGIYCLVTMIRGCVIGSQRVHRPALAIPFFRG